MKTKKRESIKESRVYTALESEIAINLKGIKLGFALFPWNGWTHPSLISCNSQELFNF